MIDNMLNVVVLIMKTNPNKPIHVVPTNNDLKDICKKFSKLFNKYVSEDRDDNEDVNFYFSQEDNKDVADDINYYEEVSNDANNT